MTAEFTTMPTTTTTPWDPSQVWWYTQGQLRPRQPPAPSPISGLLDSVLTPGSGGGGGESVVAAAQVYYHSKLIHAQVTVPAPPGLEHTVDLDEIDGRTVIIASKPAFGHLPPYCYRSQEKAELLAASSQEAQVLQTEISLCRQREADILLAYEELRHRVPWLEQLFNSNEPISACIKKLKGGSPTECRVSTTDTTPHLSPVHHPNMTHQPTDYRWSRREEERPVRKFRRSGSDSPLSDSGCTSESHDELSLASLTSAHSSPYLRLSAFDHAAVKEPASSWRQTHLGRSKSITNPFNFQSEAPPCGCHQDDLTKQSVMAAQLRNQREKTTSDRPATTFGRITDSLRKSITKFADKSEWKMEALKSQHREARTLILLNETQAELRKVEARCCGLKRQNDQQESRMTVRGEEIERLTDTERQLRRELRNWQQRVFELEAEVSSNKFTCCVYKHHFYDWLLDKFSKHKVVLTQEIKRNSQIAELEMKSRLLEANMRISEMEQLLQQNSTFSQIMQGSTSLLSSDKSGRATPQLGHSLTDSVESYKPPKFVRLLEPNGVSLPRPTLGHRFASTLSLNGSGDPDRLQSRSRQAIERHASSQQINRRGEQVRTVTFNEGTRPAVAPLNLHTKSFGSLSELELKADL
ncbi:unnamed protein product [Schistocephalus solidus]|uniref:Coiled-coil domain-containing protein 160 n=1 Tax=Schistocephalus solidus TaxID=70667 RepID=A0A183SHU3_SCHSO|nr:unnamed protein product [Schistocephalus solidus]